MPWDNDTVSSGSSVKLMTFEEILHFNQLNFQIPLTKSDLYPEVNPDRVIDLFAAMMQHVNSDFDVHIKQRSLLALVSNDRPEDYDNYSLLRNLFSIMKGFLKHLGYNDFTFSDIVAPKPVRTRTILSQLMAFMLFADSRFERAKCLEEKLGPLKWKRDELAKLEPSLQRELTDVNAALARSEIGYQQVCRNYEERKIKLEKMMEKRSLLQSLVTDIKISITDLKEGTEKLSCDVGNLKVEAKRLDELVALEPDKLVDVIACRQTELSNRKVEIQAQKSRLALLFTIKTTNSNWKFRMSKDVENITAIIQLLKAVSSLEQQYSNLKHKGKSSRSEIADLQAILDDLQRQLVASDEKWNSLEQQHRAKVKAKNVQLKDIKKNKKRLSRTANEKEVVIESLNKEMEQCHISKDQLLKEIAKLESDYPAEYSNIMKRVNCFHLEFSEILQSYEEAIDAIGVIKL